MSDQEMLRVGDGVCYELMTRPACLVVLFHSGLTEISQNEAQYLEMYALTFCGYVEGANHV